MTLKMFEEGDNLYIEIAGDPSLKKKIKEGLSSLVGKELVHEINGLLPKEEKPKLPDNWLNESIRLLTPKEEPQGENNQQDRDWDDWGEQAEKREEPAKAEPETKPETEEVTIIADDDDDW